jgi:hypothetical protein
MTASKPPVMSMASPPVIVIIDPSARSAMCTGVGAGTAAGAANNSARGAE